MKKLYCIPVVLIVVAMARPAWAETNLGIKIQQGDNGHPVVVEVIPKVGDYKTLGAYLQLKQGDEIYTAHSDPIALSDGKTYDTWDINSIEDLRWVLARTDSRIGLTVKRDGMYIKAVAVYQVHTETVMRQAGEKMVPMTVQRGVWELQRFDPTDNP